MKDNVIAYAAVLAVLVLLALAGVGCGVVLWAVLR